MEKLIIQDLTLSFRERTRARQESDGRGRRSGYERHGKKLKKAANRGRLSLDTNRLNGDPRLFAISIPQSGAAVSPQLPPNDSNVVLADGSEKLALIK